MTNRHGKDGDPYSKLSFLAGMVVGMVAVLSFLLAIVLLARV